MREQKTKLVTLGLYSVIKMPLACHSAVSQTELPWPLSCVYNDEYTTEMTNHMNITKQTDRQTAAT